MLTNDPRLLAHNIQDIHFPEIKGVEFRNCARVYGWCIGSNGSVWSRKLAGGGRGSKKFELGITWNPVKLQINKETGYYCVSFKYNNKTRTIYVHKLVLEAFVGPAPKGMRCRHLDDIKSNNNLSNLCWGTPLENLDDARKHGKAQRGETNGHAIVKEEHVLRARELRKQGMSYTNIHETIKRETGLNIAYITVYQFTTGANWKHLEM